MENLNYKNKNIDTTYINLWDDYLVNYIPHPIKKLGGFIDNVVIPLKKNTPNPNQTIYKRRKKLRKPKTQKKCRENIIKSIRNLFLLKKENKEVKCRTTRDIWTLFEQEDEYYKPKRGGNFENNN